jgi:hypothetical protein
MVKSAEKLINKKVVVVGGTSGYVVLSLQPLFRLTNIVALGLAQHKHFLMQERLSRLSRVIKTELMVL